MWTGGSVVVLSLHSVVTGSISSGGDLSIHCWWDLIRSKQLSNVSICHAQIFVGFSVHGNSIHKFLPKSPMRPPKTIKDRLKTCLPKSQNNLNKNYNLPLAKLEKYIWMSKWTMKDQEAHSAFSQIRYSSLNIKNKVTYKNKLCNTQGSTKFLQRTYSMESMDCDTDCIVANFNREYIIWLLYLNPFYCVQMDKLNLFLNVTYKPST